MRTPRIFHPQPLQCGARTTLGAAATHYVARVLRLRAGASLTLFNGRGGEYGVTLESIGRNDAVAIVDTYQAREAESPLHVTLAQGISRGERMDFTLQKAVELGVTAVVPLFTMRGNVRLSGTRLENRIEHWRGVISSACEQSGRNHIPKIEAPQGLAEWLSTLEQPRAAELTPSFMSDIPLRILFDPEGSHSLGSLARPQHGITALIGPEGGLSQEEIAAAQRRGFIAARLGPRVLRTETAGVVGLSVLQALWGDLCR
jgi:16S rRNA (uracil1498-N3)-methyltransferase